MKKRMALILAIVMVVVAVTAPVALADNGVGNIVGFPSTPGGAICIDSVNGGTVNNCHGADALHPNDPIKFDGLQPGVYVARSGSFKAFVYVYPRQDNWVNWGWMVPGYWCPPMAVPMAPSSNMWIPGAAMTHGAPPPTMISVEQNVHVTGSGTVGQAVDVKTAGPAVIHIGQSVTMKPAVPSPKCFSYIVKKGDSLSKIAVKYGDTVAGLTSRNHISNPSKIYAGQKIIVCGH